MDKQKINDIDVADALINLAENANICDAETAKGFHSSNKKDILKSSKEKSFSRFTAEIVKTQNRKD